MKARGWVRRSGREVWALHCCWPQTPMCAYHIMSSGLFRYWALGPRGELAGKGEPWSHLKMDCCSWCLILSYLLTTPNLVLTEKQRPQASRLSLTPPLLEDCTSSQILIISLEMIAELFPSDFFLPLGNVPEYKSSNIIMVLFIWWTSLY